jgi:hypothetical protein
MHEFLFPGQPSFLKSMQLKNPSDMITIGSCNESELADSLLQSIMVEQVKLNESSNYNLIL